MERVDKLIQEAMDSSMMGWSMSNILEQIKKEGLDVDQAKSYIMDKYLK
tara:strand:+ start:330 stop:476 length:147 start_codon:yes stop_codon:yes gene_type:complete